MFLEGFGRVVEAVPAQAVEVAGSGVAVHYSLTTPARGGKKRMKCVTLFCKECPLGGAQNRRNRKSCPTVR